MDGGMLSIFATVLCNLRNSTSVNARDLSFYGNCQLSLRPQIPAAAAGDRDSGREAAAAGLVTTSDVKTTRPYIAPATRPPTPSSASLLSSWSQSQAKAKGNKNLGSSEQNDVDEKKKVATDDRQSPSQSSLSASSAHNNKPFKPKSRFRNRPSTKSPPSSSRDQQPSSSPRDQHTSSLSRDQKQPLADEPTEECCVSQRSVRPTASNKSDAVYKLYNLLTKDYKKNIRPVRDWAKETEINLDVALLEVIGLEESNGKISVRLWLRMDWNDDYLKWHPHEYKNIDTIYLSANDIWIPDIELYNAVQSNIEREVTCAINYTGRVTLVMPAIYTITCKHKFRSNTWVCPFEFASWSYDVTQLRIKSRRNPVKMDDGRYKTSDYWAVANSTGIIDEGWKRDCCPNSWAMMRLDLHLRGKLGPSLVHSE